MADHVALMREGRVVQVGTPQEMYAHPTDPEAAAFLGDSVQVECEVIDTDDATGTTTVDCALGTLRVARDCVHADRTLVLRPEQIEIADTGVPARVSATRYFGHDGLVQLTLTDGTPLRLRIAGAQLPAVDAPVKVRAIASG